MAINFENIVQTLKQGVTGIAEKDLKGYIAAATKDGQAVIDGFKNDLETWTNELSQGEMSKADFNDLVLGQKDEMQMVALKEAGLAEIAADQFKLDIVNLITTTIMTLIP